MGTASHPIIVYVHSDKRYVELCDISEESAIFSPHVDCDGDASAIRVTNDDSCHTHAPDGSCNPLTARYRTAMWYALRHAAGRSYVAGFDWVRP